MFRPVTFSMRGLQNKQNYTYLPHSPKHLLATPFRKSPVVVVLLDSSHANRAVAAAAPAQEPSSRDMAGTTVEPWLWRSDDVPVSLTLVVFRPAEGCCCQ